MVVARQHAYVVERLGRFAEVLDAGFHILVPFVDAIRYRHVLKEQAMDIPEQVRITKDNVQVAVDGILYPKVMDPARASHGISNYVFAISQLAQTTVQLRVAEQYPGRRGLDHRHGHERHPSPIIREVE